MIEEAKDERKGISCEKCSMCGGAFVYEIKVEEKPEEDGKAPPPGVIIFHEATHHIVAKWCPKCSGVKHTQESAVAAEPEKETPVKPAEPYTGEFPKGTRVVITEVDKDQAKEGLAVGMRGVTTESEHCPWVELDKPVKGIKNHCFTDPQLALEKDYVKPKFKAKTGGEGK